MGYSPPRFIENEVALPVGTLEEQAAGWLDDGKYRQLSPRTLEARRDLVSKLLWFLRQREAERCGLMELRSFLAYMSRGHEEPGGRWGNPRLTKPVKPSTIETHFVNLRTLFTFLVAEGVIDTSPMDGLKPPVVRDDQVQPFTNEQVAALLEAAHRSRYPRRNEAILYFLLDTGARASELCGLRMRDLDLKARQCRVLGKGNKARTLPLGRQTVRALWAYLQRQEREPGDPVFAGERVGETGEPLTRSGLLQIIHDLGQRAGLEAVRSSPHTCRHYFAINFLRAGGNVFTLKEILGHTSLTMVNRYLKIAQADVAAQHRQFSPMDRLRRQSAS
jgi:integrase/recombinase XerD